MIPRRGGDIRSVPGLWWRDPARDFENCHLTKAWGNLWEIWKSMGNILEIYGKYIGNILEIYGKYVGHIWEIYGKYIHIHTYDYIYIHMCV
jgi:hypothetical protein